MDSSNNDSFDSEMELQIMKEIEELVRRGLLTRFKDEHGEEYFALTKAGWWVVRNFIMGD